MTAGGEGGGLTGGGEGAREGGGAWEEENGSGEREGRPERGNKQGKRHTPRGVQGPASTRQASSRGGGGPKPSAGRPPPFHSAPAGAAADAPLSSCMYHVPRDAFEQAGVAHFTRSAARTAGSRYGVRLLALCPEYVDTPLVTKLMKEVSHRAVAGRR